MRSENQLCTNPHEAALINDITQKRLGSERLHDLPKVAQLQFELCNSWL